MHADRQTHTRRVTLAHIHTFLYTSSCPLIYKLQTHMDKTNANKHNNTPTQQTHQNTQAETNMSRHSKQRDQQRANINTYTNAPIFSSHNNYSLINYIFFYLSEHSPFIYLYIYRPYFAILSFQQANAETIEDSEANKGKRASHSCRQMAVLGNRDV